MRVLPLQPASAANRGTTFRLPTFGPPATHPGPREGPRPYLTRASDAMRSVYSPATHLKCAWPQATLLCAVYVHLSYTHTHTPEPISFNSGVSPRAPRRDRALLIGASDAMHRLSARHTSQVCVAQAPRRYSAPYMSLSHTHTPESISFNSGVRRVRCQ